MDEKTFLKYLLKTHKITPEQAKRCWQESVSQQQKVVETLIKRGYFSRATLKQYAIEFKKNYSLQAEPPEKTPSVLTPEENLLAELNQVSPDETESKKTLSVLTPEENLLAELNQVSTDETESKKTPFVLTPEENLLAELNQASTDETESKKTSSHGTLLAVSPSNEKTEPLSSPKSTGPAPIVPTERYEVLQTLGEGGMGVVQLVKDTLLGRHVALKKIKGNQNPLKNLSARQRAMFWRFNKEAEITAFLEHPNIVPLYEMQHIEEGEISFTMRKVEGDTLRKILKSKREGEEEYDENKLLGIYLKVCDAMAYAHSRGVIHRDLKPDNIMVGQFGEVYVMDWGIAKKQENQAEINIESQIGSLLKKTFTGEETAQEQQTQGGMGTEGYMAPEQRENAHFATPQSDIYALGQILRESFTLLSPREEFQKQIEEDQIKIGVAKGKREVQEKSLEKSIPSEIQAIIEKATKTEAEERYQSVKELSADIERYQKNLTVSVQEYNVFQVFAKWIQRHKQQVGFTSVIGLILMISIGFQLWKSKQAELAKFNEREEAYRKAIQNATEEKEASQKLVQIGLKIGKLLRAMNYLNGALLLKPQDKAVEQEKLEVGESLLELCYESKDYQLASYVAREIQALSIAESSPKKWEEEVKAESEKTLKKHLKQFAALEKKFREKNYEHTNEKTDGIYEISKMQEKEIFEKLIVILKEGTEYFQGESTDTRTDEFYESMVEALGRIGNPEAGPYLMESLETLKTNAQGNADKMRFMVCVANALGNSKAMEQSKKLDQVRWQMGQNSLFWQNTETTSQKLTPRLISEYDTSLNLNPQDALTYVKRGIAKSSIRDYEGAIKDYDKAIRLNPQYALAYNNRGNVKRDNRDYKGAIKDYDEAIRLNPQYAFAYNNRGNAKQASQDYKGAIKDYDEAIRLNPQYALAYNNRGNVKQASQDYKGAIKDYDEAIRLNPQYAEAYSNRGNAKQASRDYKGAIKDYDEAIHLNPQDAEAYSNRGNAKQASQDYKGAIKDYDEAIRLNPQYALAYNNRGNVKQASQDYKGAIKDYDEAIRLNPQYAEAYSNRGNAKQASQDYKGAIKDYDEAIRLNPQYAGAYNNRGKVKYDSRDYKGAIKDYDEAIHLNPQDAEAYSNRGNAKQASQDYKGAIKDYDEAIRLNPQYALAYNNRGNVKQASQDYKGAIKDYDEAIRLNPQYAEAYSNRGNAKQASQDYKGAIKDYDEAIRLNPQYAEAYYNRGNAKYYSRDYKGAIKDYDEAIRLNPQYAAAYSNRGITKYNKGEKLQAKEDFQKYLELTRNATDAQTQKTRQQILQVFPDLNK